MSATDKPKPMQSDWSVKDLNEIDRGNLLGFFALLLKVDKRVNPHLYKNIKKSNENNRSTNNPN